MLSLYSPIFRRQIFGDRYICSYKVQEVYDSVRLSELFEQDELSDSEISESSGSPSPGPGSPGSHDSRGTDGTNVSWNLM